MSQFATTGRVVVGTDGSTQASIAVKWAAAWANLHQLGLTIVGVQPDLMIYADGVAYASLVDPAFAAAKEAAQRNVRAAMKLATETYPGLNVVGQTVEGDAAGILVTASRDARLVVIGTRGLGAVKGVLLGGVADNVVTNAKGPLVVVPEATAETVDEKSPIIVGSDASGGASLATRMAVVEAVAQKCPLVVIQVLDRDPLENYMPGEAYEQARGRLEADLKQKLSQSLATQVTAHPDLDLSVRVVVGKPAVELAKASEGARMVMVGSRGRGGFAGLMLGSTSRRLVRTSVCPVMVVRGIAAIEAVTE